MQPCHGSLQRRKMADLSLPPPSPPLIPFFATHDCCRSCDECMDVGGWGGAGWASWLSFFPFSPTKCFADRPRNYEGTFRAHKHDHSHQRALRLGKPRRAPGTPSLAEQPTDLLPDSFTAHTVSRSRGHAVRKWGGERRCRHNLMEEILDPNLTRMATRSFSLV